MLLHACAAVVAALSLLGGAAAHAAEPEGELARRLEAIVRIHADVPAEARTAAYLGTTRDGAGVVIDDAGLIVTIGYLITEAMGAEVTTAAGKVSRADVIGFDIASEHNNIAAWLGRIKALPGWKHPYDLMPGHPLPAR